MPTSLFLKAAGLALCAAMAPAGVFANTDAASDALAAHLTANGIPDVLLPFAVPCLLDQLDADQMSAFVASDQSAREDLLGSATDEDATTACIIASAEQAQ